VFATSASDLPGIATLLSLLSIPALIALNGLFVAAEFALVAVRKTRVEEMVGRGVQGARSVLAAITRLDRSIAATQLGITLASIGLGFISEPALVYLIEPLFTFLPPGWSWLTSHGLAVALAFVLITFLHVVFGELIPKNLALQIPDRAALWIARPLLGFTYLSRPLILLINGTGSFILRLAGYKTTGSVALVHTVEELLLLIEDTEEAGMLEPDQAEFVENVFRLSSKRVGECLVPREKMAVLEVSTPPDKVLEAVRSGAHTRMPVYEGDLDRIVGIVNTKDLFYLFSLKGVVILQDALYPAHEFKPSETMANALRHFRKTRTHMALVRDDSGTIRGLITLEDVLEEIVGDIEDEHDRPTPKLPPRGRRLPLPLERTAASRPAAAVVPRLVSPEKPAQAGETPRSA
jgi:CBS domain containing-hemolysin-like protein